MKKSAKICLILALLMLMSGSALVFYALYSTGFDWNKLTINEENETYDQSVTQTFQKIQIDAKQVDVRVVASSNSRCIVRYKLASRDACAIKTDDGVLHVTCNAGASAPLYKRFWRQDETELTVFLPDKTYDELKIVTGSGDVFVGDTVAFASARAKTGSGDVEFCAPVTDGLSVTTESGDLAVKRTGCKTISVNTGAGTVLCENCRTDSLSVTASSGDVTISKCTLKNIKANTASGDVFCSQSSVSELLDVTSGSGEITLSDSTADTIQITAKSGDVTGMLCEPMLFDVRSDSGKIELPPSGGTKSCTVRTGSGDVTFVMQDSSAS